MISKKRHDNNNKKSFSIRTLHIKRILFLSITVCEIQQKKTNEMNLFKLNPFIYIYLYDLLFLFIKEKKTNCSNENVTKL